MTKNQIEYWRNVENQRNNLAVEKETQRANFAKENEINRANLASEHETNRHNTAMERIGLQTNQIKAQQVSNEYSVANRQIAETTRANIARETENTKTREENIKVQNRQASAAQYGALTNRYSQESQAERNLMSNRISLSNFKETVRSNQAREQELRRSNLAQEQIKSQLAELESKKINEQQRHNLKVEDLTKRGQNLNLVSGAVTPIVTTLAKLMKG